MSMSNAMDTPKDTFGANPPLEIPKPSPKIGMNDPEFENLTNAEKLNDRNYRERIYEIYPNEATCACKSEAAGSNANLSEDKSDASKTSRQQYHLVCKSGCKQACCSSARQSVVESAYPSDANKNDRFTTFRPTRTYNEYVKCKTHKEREDQKQKVHNGDYCNGATRLRGGGDGEEPRAGENGMRSEFGRVNEAMPRRFDDAWIGTNGCNVNRRLEGGGGVGYEYAERYPSTRTPCYRKENPAKVQSRGSYREQPQDSHLDTNQQHRSPNACASTLDPYGIVAAGCCCPGKENLVRSTRQRENIGICSKKKPCPGVDCLIKAFRETQEFVDSLGRVPGLAGLGLMDPADSPYFGRDKPKEERHDRIKTAVGLPDTIALPNTQCVGPCNPQMLKPVGVNDDPFFGATPFTIAVPGRGGVIREAVPALPGPGFTYAAGKTRKKDDKNTTKEMDAIPMDIETGPCGEPRCKAKRRTNDVPEPPSTEEIKGLSEKMDAVHADTNIGKIWKNGNKQKGSLKMRSGKSSFPGPGGDRIGRKRSSGRTGRRSIRFVYSAGDTYSGSTCGHKNCVEERHRVPGNMGWLWNLNETVGRLKPRPGWKPGAIARHISEILREAKRLDKRKTRTKSRSSSSSRSRSRSAPSRGKRTKVSKDRASVKKFQGRKKDEDKEEIEPPPTLHIHRKDGTYYVTMYPIKQDTMDVPKLEEPMKPLQFKIAKNKDDASLASSSTASDMEIEFSPPAAVNRYHKKPDVVHVDTQVKQQEILDAYKSDNGKKSEKKKGKKGKK